MDIGNEIEFQNKIIVETIGMVNDGKLSLLETMQVIEALSKFAEDLKPIWRKHTITSMADF